MLSPAPSLSSPRGNKRAASSQVKRWNQARNTSSHLTSVNIVKDQYIVIRQKCLSNFGARVGSYVFDTSYAGLLDWIRHERITRLPHKGGSWDRVLIGAQYFAAQVDRLREAITLFTPECDAASHLVFGQCLLLLEVCLICTHPILLIRDVLC